MNQEKIEQVLKAAVPVALIAGAIVALAAIGYAAVSVFHLFAQYVKLSVPESIMAVLSSVGMAVALLLTIITTKNQNARGMGAILVIAWVLLVLTMVALDSVLRADLVSAPDALLQIGRIVAALLPALALAGVICMAIALHDTTLHKSAAGASSRYVGFAAKGVAIAASVFASAYFGVQRGINPILAALCGVLLESAFLWSYLSLKQARDRGDRFDVGMWSFCTLAFGAFIAAVSVETLSTLGGIDVPVVSMLGEIGATLYVSAVGLSLILTVLVHLLTRAIDMPAKASQDTINVRRPAPLSTRIAGSIRGARAGVGEIREAWREGAPAQLPTAATLADDGMTEAEARKLVEGALKPDKELMVSGKKVSENGTLYDTTGFAVPRDEAADLMRRHREMLDREAQRPK